MPVLPVHHEIAGLRILRESTVRLAALPAAALARGPRLCLADKLLLGEQPTSPSGRQLQPIKARRCP